MSILESPPAAALPGDVLVQMRQQVGELGQVLWAARSRQELMDTVCEAEALKASIDPAMLPVLRELEATGGVKPEGWASTADFATAVTGGRKGAGPAAVRFAEVAAEPLYAPLAAAMADGWLSTTKAQVIWRTIDTLPGDTDLRRRGLHTLLEEAGRLDATDLRRAGRHLLTVIDPDGEDRRTERELDREERAAHLGRHLAIREDHAGGAWLNGRCTAEDAATIKTILMSLAAPIPTTTPTCRPDSCDIPGCAHDGRDPRDHGARMLDALVELCARSQTAELLPTDHGATPRLSLLINHQDLLTGLGVGTTGTGEEIPAGAVRRLCCDAEILPTVLGTASEVLDLGRTTRLVTPGLWKALLTRDRHCRFPGCTRPPLMCHAHHIHHWADGGPTSLDNLILLCGHHHRLIHAGPWHITPGTDNHFHFSPPPAVNRSRVNAIRPPPRE